VLLLSLIAASGLAQTPARPRCNASIQARFWPDEANGNPQLVQQLAQSGDLEICSYGTWKYKWVPVSLNVKRFLKHKNQSKRIALSPETPPIEDNVRRR
jgi:hypothetical protein